MTAVGHLDGLRVRFSIQSASLRHYLQIVLALLTMYAPPLGFGVLALLVLWPMFAGDNFLIGLGGVLLAFACAVGSVLGMIAFVRSQPLLNRLLGIRDLAEVKLSGHIVTVDGQAIPLGDILHIDHDHLEIVCQGGQRRPLISDARPDARAWLADLLDAALQEYDPGSEDDIPAALRHLSAETLQHPQ